MKTRDPERIDKVLKQLEAFWKANPDYRLGQIVGNAGMGAGLGTDPYYMEDDVFLHHLWWTNEIG